MPHIRTKSVLEGPGRDEFPTVRRVYQWVSEGRTCCRRECLRRVWESFRDDLQQFSEDVATCSRDVKEAAMLMNLREHLYPDQSCRIRGQRQRVRVAYSIAPFGRLCRQAYVVLWDIGGRPYGRFWHTCTVMPTVFAPERMVSLEPPPIMRFQMNCNSK